ncbi:MAG TPA: phosphoribosylaminoimidazolesuccinocarboxamide synthase [Candidatus Peribacterales bacterium]|nr:phosphoribosylaminoimidazolesuccinocarboxamide synthase [Candidatus Peribacterales bacterium]
MIDPSRIQPFLTNTIQKTNFPGLGARYQGKVRDVYTEGDRVILISTDRQSAFDEDWCTIPLKGQALNQMSAWWFDQIKDVMPTHVIEVPDPNVTIAKKLTMVKVEVVVRAYLTGSTSTSAWVNYKNGVRNFCGNPLPEGMVKNQKFDEIIFTPSTKPETGHDVSASPEELIAMGVTTPEEIEELKKHAFALFRKGQKVALERGLILVDTKYEMGYDKDGVLRVGDEVHTPDSSRYWIAKTYEERFAKGEEPESLDKEFFRLWLREQGFEYGKLKPTVTDEARVMLATRYIDLYERMTGKKFEVEEGDVTKRMEKNIARYIVPAHV